MENGGHYHTEHTLASLTAWPDPGTASVVVCSGGSENESRGEQRAWGRQEEALGWRPEPQLLLCTQVSQRDLESEKRLRKDLKRTKALLADAQIMLDHLKNNAPSKREIAQLKNQVSGQRGGGQLQGANHAYGFSSFSPCLPLSGILESLRRKVTGEGEATRSHRTPRICACQMA